MELVDRYLRILRAHLPWGQQDDIIRELSENLRSQIEDREAQLGRPLTEEEINAILEHHGNPVVVAGRYQAEERSLVVGRKLIGPELFPLYTRILAINLGVTLIACIVLLTTLPGVRSVGQIVQGTLVNLAIQCGVVTAIFVVARTQLARHPNRWDPRKAGAMRRDLVRPGPSRPRLVVELVGLLVGTIWWLSVPSSIRPFSRPAGDFLAAGPAWPTFYVALLALTIAHIVVTCVSIARPRWMRFRAAALAALHGLGAAVGFYCVGIGTWVAPAGTSADPALLGKLALINQWSNVGVAMFATISAFLCLTQAWRLTRMKAARDSLGGGVGGDFLRRT